jgi:hypothetical protein
LKRDLNIFHQARKANDCGFFKYPYAGKTILLINGINPRASPGPPVERHLQCCPEHGGCLKSQKNHREETKTQKYLLLFNSLRIGVLAVKRKNSLLKQPFELLELVFYLAP